jgi:hypothetical protein
MTDLFSVLVAIRPGAAFVLSGDDYEGLTWLDDSQTMPSKAECEAAWPQVQYQRNYAAVEQARREAYERDADPLFFRWQRGTGTEQEWLDAVQGVKDANPYPVGP